MMDSKGTITLSDPPRICITRLSALGDVIHTLPLLSVLRQTYPSAHIGWIVEPSAYALVNHHPDLNAVHIAERKLWVSALYNPFKWWAALSTLRRFKRDIAAQRYDVVVDTQGLAKSGLVSWLSGIKQRLGFTPCREGAHRWYTHTVERPWAEFDPHRHVAQSYDTLAGALGCPPSSHATLQLPPASTEAKQAAARLFAQTTDRPIVILAPATRWPSKHWPVKYWQQLVTGLVNQSSALVVGVGAATEKTLLDDVLGHAQSQADRTLNLAGLTSLESLPAVLNSAAVVIGPDSLVAHLAGALNNPAVLALFGPTSAMRTSPLGTNVSTLACDVPLDCQPCHSRTCHLPRQECMDQLLPDTVLQRVLNQLKVRQLST